MKKKFYLSSCVSVSFLWLEKVGKVTGRNHTSGCSKIKVKDEKEIKKEKEIWAKTPKWFNFLVQMQVPPKHESETLAQDESESPAQDDESETFARDVLCAIQTWYATQ